MKRSSHQTSISQELDHNGFGDINSSIELPAAEEFAWTNEEVREVCAVFRDIETVDGTS